VEAKTGVCATYVRFDEKTGKETVLLGSGFNGEVKTITPEAIEFVCHGESDDGTLVFPYISRYSMTDGRSIKRPVFLSVETPLDYGAQVLPNFLNELVDVLVTEDTVRLEITTPINNLPMISVRSDSKARALLVKLTGIRTAMSLPAVYSPHGAIVDMVKVQPEPGTEPAVKLEILIGTADWTKLTYTGIQAYGNEHFIELRLSDKEKPTDLRIDVPDSDK